MMHYVIALLSQIYCEGPLLKAVQEARLFNDSKYFVDMPLKFDPMATLKDFEKIADKIKEDKELLSKFVDSHFSPPGTDLETCVPDDWKPSFTGLSKIKDEKFRFWAEQLHLMWRDLCRQELCYLLRIDDTTLAVKFDVYENAELYSLLYVPNKFVVPGGRFREFYYWDSYWIIKGLLYSEMYSTAKGMIKNFAYMVEHYGFVPNGGRVYYLLRSQPPMLIPMVYEYYNATSDLEFVRQMMPVLVNEYKFWISKRSAQYRDSPALFQYKVNMKSPRPESYREDMELVEHLTTLSEKERVWSDVAAAAETGWDFSSRWFAHEGASAHRMASVRTASILPVDLNAFMCMNSRMLSELYKLLGDNAKSLLYEARFNQAKMIMTEMHWNATDGIWYDYDLEGHKHIRAYYISNAMPLFAHCYDDNGEDKPLKVYEYMKAMGAFNSTKGIPTSFINSEQQWDAANSWPPMVHMIIEGFRTSKNTFLQTFAEKLAAQWLRANHRVFVETNAMYEKYDCSAGAKAVGSGGEYEVQTGFGWTNGVVLDLLKTYGDIILSEEEQLQQQKQQEPSIPLDDLSAAPKKLASVVYELIESVVAHPAGEFENQPEFPSFTDNEEDEIVIDVDAETPEPPPLVVAPAPLPIFQRSSDEF